MVTPSSILSWRIPRTEEPGGLQSRGSQRVGRDWSLRNEFFLRNEVPYWNKIGTYSELKERSSSLKLTRCVAIEYGG